MDNHIIWADIPVTDLERAREFYSQMLGIEIVTMPGVEGVAIPRPEGEPLNMVSFDLYVVGMDDRKPGEQGPTIYFDAQDAIDAMVERAEAAGGSLLQGPQDMGPMVGVIAFLRDTEGNRIGIRQPSAQQG